MCLFYMHVMRLVVVLGFNSTSKSGFNEGEGWWVFLLFLWPMSAHV